MSNLGAFPGMARIFCLLLSFNSDTCMLSRKWILPLILVSLVIFFLSLRQLSDPDLGFHLKYGRWISANLQVPSHDLSTYTVQGHAYTDLHWLFQVVLYQVFRLTGYPGISVLVCMLSLIVSLLMMLRNRVFSIPLPVSLVAVFAGFVIIEPRITPRPEMFTFIFLSTVLLILDLYIRHRKNYLFLLPLIMLIWCNMHALSVLGLIVIAVYWFSMWIRDHEYNRSLLIWLALSVAACMINPYGVRGFSFPLELLTRFDPQNIYNQHIQEFMPFYAQPRFAIRDYLFIALLAIVVMCTAATIRRRSLHEVILPALFALLAIGSVRNLPLFVLAAMPVAGREITEISSRMIRFQAGFRRILFFAMVLFPTIMLPGVISSAWYSSNNSFNKTGVGLNRSHQPVEAAAFIASGYPGARILNSIGYGGWLSWIIPQPVFIDGRLEVMQEPLYSQITRSWNDGLPLLVARYKPDLVVYNYLNYYPWTPQLAAMQGWRLVFLDGQAAVFTSDTNRMQFPTVGLSYLPVANPASPGSRLQAVIIKYFRQPDEAASVILHENQFKRQMEAGKAGMKIPQDAIDFFNRANQAYRAGKMPDALAFYDTSIVIHPGYVKAYNNRGILRAAAFRDFSGAISDFNRALQIDPTFGDAYLGRGTAYFYLKDTANACRDWTSARSCGNGQAGQLIGLHCKAK